MPVVTALSTSKRNAARCVIHVDGRAAATLSRSRIESLHITAGSPWTDELSRLVREAVELDEAFDFAMKQVNRRPLSRSQLEHKLNQHGCTIPVITATLERLTAIGAINDADLAADLVAEIDRRRPAGPALKRAKLQQRGLDESLIEETLAAGADRDAQIAAARALIASRSKSLARYDDRQRRQKLYGLLSRRGFDEDVIESVLGAIHEEE